MLNLNGIVWLKIMLKFTPAKNWMIWEFYNPQGLLVAPFIEK